MLREELEGSIIRLSRSHGWLKWRPTMAKTQAKIQNFVFKCGEVKLNITVGENLVTVFDRSGCRMKINAKNPIASLQGCTGYAEYYGGEQIAKLAFKFPSKATLNLEVFRNPEKNILGPRVRQV